MDDVRSDGLMLIKGNWDNIFLEFSKEEQDAKKARGVARNKVIGAAMKEAHAAKKAGSKKLAQKMLLYRREF